MISFSRSNRSYPSPHRRRPVPMADMGPGLRRDGEWLWRGSLNCPAWLERSLDAAADGEEVAVFAVASDDHQTHRRRTRCLDRQGQRATIEAPGTAPVGLMVVGRHGED